MRKLTFYEMMNILRAVCIYARNIMVHLDFWKVSFLHFQLNFPKELGLFHRIKFSNLNSQYLCNLNFANFLGFFYSIFKNFRFR